MANRTAEYNHQHQFKPSFRPAGLPTNTHVGIDAQCNWVVGLFVSSGFSVFHAPMSPQLVRVRCRWVWRVVLACRISRPSACSVGGRGRFCRADPSTCEFRLRIPPSSPAHRFTYTLAAPPLSPVPYTTSYSVQTPSSRWIAPSHGRADQTHVRPRPFHTQAAERFILLSDRASHTA